MADAVHYLCDNPAVPSDASGCDGFPFQLNAGSGPNYPLGISIQDLAKWWYRVKNWSVTSTWTATTGGVTSTFGYAIGPSGRNAIRELDLIGPTTLPQHNFGFASSGNGQVNLSLFDTFPSVAPSYAYANAGIYNPFLSCNETSIQPNVFSPDNSISFSFNPDDFGLVPPTGSFTAVVDGNNVTCYYLVSTVPPDSFSVGTLIFTPIEYWPYAAADGSPIYNTVTGAQLQDPRN